MRVAIASTVLFLSPVAGLIIIIIYPRHLVAIHLLTIVAAFAFGVIVGSLPPTIDRE